MDLLLLPELALSRSLREAVRERMRERLPRSGGVQLVLLGTASEDTLHNRALLTGPLGDVVAHQDKLHPYTMSPGEQSRYDLETELGGEPIQERIKVSPRILHVLDFRRLGRVAVFVCEDAAHVALAEVASRLGVELLLCPVMDGPLQLDRWVARFASSYVNAHLMQVVSVNSIVLGERARDRHGASASPPPWGVGFAQLSRAPAGGAGRGPLDFAPRLVGASGPEDLQVLEIRLRVRDG